MRLFYVFILDMNNNISKKNILQSNNLLELSRNQNTTLSSSSLNLLKNAVHQKTMKTPENNKFNKTLKHMPYNNHQNMYHQNNNHNSNFISREKNKKNKKKTLYSLKKHPDYLEKLINTYYDNDECVHKYLSTAHHKLHILPPARRIIVIGDIHGDFDAAIKCLILGGCIEPIEPPDIKSIENMDAFFKMLKWTGGETQVVQLGDQIDRVRPRRWNRHSISQTEAHEDEGSTLEIFYLFWKLHHLAQQARPLAGAVYCIIGNHEIMNVEGNFSYVSSAEFNAFKNHLAHVYYANSKYPYYSRTLKNTRDIRKSKGLPDGYRERLYAFSPTGICSNFMAQNYYTLLQIGNWLFCHGSPTLSTLATYEIDLLNTITSMYLLGIDSQNEDKIEYHFDKIMNNDIASKIPTSLIWSRTFGEIQPIQSDEKLETLLNKILAIYNKKNNNTSSQNKATHIAIGHTPQIDNNEQLGINSICNGHVWRCDVGMSKAFTIKTNTNTNKNRKIQVLEIINNQPHILSS